MYNESSKQIKRKLKMKLQDIILSDAEYCKNVTVLVEYNYGYVTISDDTGKNDDIFLQGDDASDFISQLNHLYNLTGDLTEQDISLHLARQYIDCIWN